MNGTARPTAAQKGYAFDLDAAMKAKMENAFGDLSAVKFYKSQAVADAGAEAIAQGNEIAFAPGKTEFTTRAGQERLGHELSHVMSQRSGQVRGSGFLNSPSLEARADREGAMAAAGQQVYAGPVTHAISDSSPSPSVAGAMQAKRSGNDEKQQAPAVAPSQDIQAPSFAPLKSFSPKEMEEIRAAKRRKQISQNVDRLYSIQAALMGGKEGEAHVSEDDMAWYEDMKMNADKDTFKEIHHRYLQSARELVDYRDALQEPDKDKRDYEASWSDPALNIDIYNSIATLMNESPGADQFQMELQEKEMERMAKGEALSKDALIDQEAGVIRDANDPENLSNKKRARYIKTEAGRKDYALRAPGRTKRYLELALAKKQKKK